MRHEDFVETLKSGGIHVFTIRDAGRILRKRGKYVSLFLSRDVHIRRVERGRYYLDGTSIDEIASHIISPCYLSFETAFKFHGLTTQIPLSIYVVSTGRHRPINLGGTTIRFIRFSRDRLFGYLYVNNISVASVEKAIVDALYRSGDCGDAVDAMGTAVAGDRLDFATMREAAIKMRCPALVNRVGFLIELYGGEAGDLLAYRSKNYASMASGARARSKRWRVLYKREWLALGKGQSHDRQERPAVT